LPRLSFSGRYHNFDAICPKQLAGTLLKELLTKVSEIPATVDFDVCGRVFEYFLGEFARTEGQKGGEFYTPRGGKSQESNQDLRHTAPPKGRLTIQ